MVKKARATKPQNKLWAKDRLSSAEGFNESAEATILMSTHPTKEASAATQLVNAAIAAADAACAFSLGKANARDHSNAPSLLRKISGGEAAANALSRLLARKSEIAYTSKSVSPTTYKQMEKQTFIVMEFARTCLRG